MLSQKCIGIDYGSKLAGTTSVCYVEDASVQFKRSEKKQDADAMLQQVISDLQPLWVAIDAPLSLPGVYTGIPGCTNYFYRHCDQLTNAMSPMFIGGLTARAIQLKDHCRAMNDQWIEAYPVKRGKDLGLEQWGYRQKHPDFAHIVREIQKHFEGIEINPARVHSSHDLDALLALEIGLRCAHGQAAHLGQAEEGLIYY